MIDLSDFYNCLRDSGVQFFAGVPDTLLNDFCNYVQANHSADRHVIAANEGNAVAVAAGYYLATGTVPLVYMQNSGLGNSVNPLISLADKSVYSLPMILLIGWRGDPASNDHAQHKKQGEVTTLLLECMGIQHRILNDDTAEANLAVKWAVETSLEQSSPVALIARKDVLAKPEKGLADGKGSRFQMSREEAMASSIELLPKTTIFVATTGRACRELHAIREAKGQGHSSDFLNVGAMGHTSSIALGLALADSDRLVVCFDGDGALLMHLGSLTTSGALSPRNILHIVLNNGVHESVGGQPTVGFKVNLTEIASAAGYSTVGAAVETRSELNDAIERLLGNGKPGFIEIKIRQGIRHDLPSLRFSQNEYKLEFMSRISGNY